MSPARAAAVVDPPAFEGRRLLVLGNTRSSSIRRYFAEAATRLGPRTVLFADPEDDAGPGLFDEVHRVPLGRRREVLGLARWLHAQEPFDGVITYIEERVELKALVAAALGLPSTSRRGSRRCRSKLAMRRALEAAGVPGPAFARVRDLDDLERALEAVGFPCVLKPVAGWSSFGVIRLDGGEEFPALLEEAVEFLRGECGDHHGFLVEELVAGPEFSCEGVVDREGIQVAGLTEKLLTPEPFFEEKQHIHPALLPDETHRWLVEWTRRALVALGVTLGGFHAELRLSPEGPRIIEIANRLGGGGIPVLVRLATGQDLAASDLAAAFGASLPLRSTRERFAGIRFFFPPREGRLRRVELELDPRRLPGIANFTLHARPGDEVRLPPHAYGTRPGWVMAVDADRGRLVETLETFDRHLIWEFD